MQEVETPLKDALWQLTGIEPPDTLPVYESAGHTLVKSSETVSIEWTGLGHLRDSDRVYEACCNWVGEVIHGTRVSWSANSALIEAAEELVRTNQESG